MTLGYLSEIFSSFQGEGGSVLGSAFGKRQIFIRLSGCNIALGEFQTDGCGWCDSPDAKKDKRPNFRIENKPGTLNFEFIPNPITPETLVSYIEPLKSSDTHSISFTGGEPTFQSDFLSESASLLKKKNFLLFLETNGATSWKNGYNNFDFYSIDLKDETSGAAVDWECLLEKEINFGKSALESLRERGNIDLKKMGIYFKLVITKFSNLDYMLPYIKEIGKMNNSTSDIKASLVIQPVSPVESFKDVPNFSLISKYSEKCAEILGNTNISLSLQVHKYMNIL